MQKFILVILFFITSCSIEQTASNKSPSSEYDKEQVSYCLTCSPKYIEEDKDEDKCASKDLIDETDSAPLTDCAPPEPIKIANPNLEIENPYFQIFKNDESAADTCYFRPRPDDSPAAKDACTKGHELFTVFTKFDLCKETVDPEIINSIPCDDALDISTELNEKLVFTKDGPFLNDVQKAGACDVDSCSDNSKLDKFCKYYSDRSETLQAGGAVTEIARLDSEEELESIAECANKMFELEVD